MTVTTVQVGIMPTNAYIAADEATKKAVIIDPGDSAAKIYDEVCRAGLTVEYIFLTHGHFDHILAVGAMKELTGAKIVIHENDANRLKRTEIAKFHPRLGKIYNETDADILASDGDVFKVGETEFRWMTTPGHTAGSCVIFADGVMFSGDTLFFENCGRCDLEGGDYEKMLVSLRRLYETDGDWRVLPGHGEETTLGHERLHNVNMLEAIR